MDETRNRSSGLPRPSRLPAPSKSALPRPTSSLQKPTSASVRPSPSRDNLRNSISGARDAPPARGVRYSASRDQLRSSIGPGAPGLRTAASRDQLRSNGSRTPAGKPKAPPLASTPRTSRIASGTQRRTSTFNDPAPLSATASEFDTEETDEVLLNRRLDLSRRQSEADPNVPTDDFLSHDTIAPDNDNAGSLASFAEEQAAALTDTKPRTLRTRPSLSERTMETLASIPSSPAVRKKSSAFFDQGTTITRPRAGSSHSRPGSSYNSDESVRVNSRQSSRPDSSGGHDEPPSSFRSSTTTFKKPLSTIHGTPRRTSGAFQSTTPGPRKTPSRGSLSTLYSSGAAPPLPDARSPSPEKKSYGALPGKGASKTVSARSTKPRGSVGGLFKKPSLPAMDGAAASNISASRQASISSAQSSANSWDGTIASLPSTTTSNEADTEPTHRKSSAALRDQIARAKAAKRAAAKGGVPSTPEVPVTSFVSREEPLIPVDDGFDFGVDHDDPFNSRKGEDPKKRVLNQRVRAARTTGRLNIAALNLKDIPTEVMKMYDLDSVGGNDGSWAESVDLTRLVGADNEFETLDDGVFPDLDPESFNMDDDEPQGSIFGGLTMMDLHNNSLINVPIGWRRLSCLTSLNLSSNRLTNESLEVISQMSSLRDLKLANNLLTGALPNEFANLMELEILDLKGNKVSSLPPDVDKMQRLRILNLSENSFEVLPFDGLSKLPLTELAARKNKLSGTLIEDSIESLPQLQTLDVSMNQLTRLIPLGSAINFPVLHALSLSMNRLQGLPDMTTWTNLLTLTVDENSMSSIPNSFMSLDKLRSADFSGNDIRVVPPEIARMENLSMIRLSGNPLRDKKFVSITTDELKEALAARLEPPPPYQEPGAGDQTTIADLMGKVEQIDLKKSSPAKPKPQSQQQGPHAINDEEDYRSDADDDFATPPTSAHHSPAHSRSDTISSLRSRSHTLSNQTWTVKQGGILDRSRTESSTLHPVVCSRVAAEHQVRAVHLEHNLLTTLPNSLSFFAATLSSLSLANNQLVGESYLTEELDLPSLKEINLSSNRITSLEPLTRLLIAPSLEKIDVAINRINSIPHNLKEKSFPSLTILLAANNHIVDLDPQSIQGLKIVDASSNDISHLNPQIGLLGGLGGLQRLEVMGNRFRVPRWSTLELGTEATLRWLRSRVPVADMAAWKKENGEDDSAEVD